MATRIPNPPQRYSQSWANEFKKQVDDLAANAFRRDKDVELGDGAVVGRSPNGTRFQILVQDDGSLTTTNLSAPAPGPTPSPSPSPAPSSHAPVNSVQAAAINALLGDTVYFNAANGTAITVGDVDGGTLTTVLSAGAGKLHVIPGSGATVTGNDSSSVKMVGTAGQINAALNGAWFVAPATEQTVIIQLTTSDTSTPKPLSDNDQVTVSVSASPPPVALPPFRKFGARTDLVNGKYPNGIVVSHKTPAQMDASIKSKWAQYVGDKNGSGLVINDPVTPGGKAINFGYPFLTVSEGMGYAMIFAVIFEDQSLFDALLKTVRNHPAYGVVGAAGPSVGNYLMDWKLFADGGRSDVPQTINGTTYTAGEGWAAGDGDMDIALALCMADSQWGTTGTTYDYKQEAINTINAIRSWYFDGAGNFAGPRWNIAIARTSDFATGHFREFAAISPNANDKTFWSTTAITRCEELLELMQNSFSSVGALMPDFIINTTGVMDGQQNPDTGRPYSGPTPSPGSFGQFTGQGTGGYGDFVDTEDRYFANAQRNPWRYGTDVVFTNDTRMKAILEKLNAWIQGKTGSNPNNVEIGYYLNGNGMGIPWPPRGMVAGFGVGALANVQRQDWANACWDWLEANWVNSYFDAELVLFALIVMSGNWWNRSAGHVATAPGPAPAPSPAPTPAPSPAPSDGWPSKVLAAYFVGWDQSINVRNVSTDYNVVYLFNAHFDNGDGSANWPWPGYPAASDVQALRARGVKVILSVGGSGYQFPFQDRTQSTKFCDSIVSISQAFGGIDGVDFNNYEGQTTMVISELVWIAQELKRRFTSDFGITSPPGANNTGGGAVNDIGGSDRYDLDLMGALADAGVLTYVAPQFYDWSYYDQPGTIAGRTADWIARVGADKVVVGMGVTGYPEPGQPGTGLSLQTCTREWDALEARYPAIRGVMGWNLQIDARNNRQWSSAMKTRVLS